MDPKDIENAIAEADFRHQLKYEIQNDPTLKMFIESEIDYKHFDTQVDLKCWAIKEAIRRSLYKY